MLQMNTYEWPITKYIRKKKDLSAPPSFGPFCKSLVQSLELAPRVKNYSPDQGINPSSCVVIQKISLHRFIWICTYDTCVSVVTPTSGSLANI